MGGGPDLLGTNVGFGFPVRFFSFCLVALKPFAFAREFTQETPNTTAVNVTCLGEQFGLILLLAPVCRTLS